MNPDDIYDAHVLLQLWEAPSFAELTLDRSTPGIIRSPWFTISEKDRHAATTNLMRLKFEAVSQGNPYRIMLNAWHDHSRATRYQFTVHVGFPTHR